MSQPIRNDLSEFTDSDGSVLLIVDGPGDTTVRPIDPQRREQLERLQQRQWVTLLDERCSIAPENLKKLRIAAERLGCSQGDLICEGLDLIVEKYHDKLGDLARLETPTEALKPQDGSPSP